MTHKFLSILAAGILSSAFVAKGNDIDTTSKVNPPLKRYYMGTSTEGAMFSTAAIKHTTAGNTTNSMGTLRFSYFINFGVTFNFNLNKHLGLYTGVDIKNVGFIEKSGSLTEKHRTYNLGIPVGIKIGNMNPKKTYGFLGAGMDAPINYREKSFTKRGHKAKFNEWFSDRTPAVMPYVFAGVAIKGGLSIKAQYYLNSFMNQDFSESGYKPYAGTDVHLMLLSIGYFMPTKNHHEMMMMKEKMKKEKEKKIEISSN